MRLTLIVSGRPASSAGALGPVLSALVHAAVVVGVAFQPSIDERIESIDEPLPQGLTFLVPPPSAPETPVNALRYDEEGGGEGVPDGAKLQDEGTLSAVARGSRDTLNASDAVAQDEVPDPAEVFSAPASIPADVFMVLEVDSAAVQDTGTVAPSYPRDMQARQIEGYVAVRFVVDTNGRVDLSTVQVVLASRPEFTQSVRQALPGMRFRPARMGTTPVRQLAEQMFRFQLPKVPLRSPTSLPP
jgi:TonB family protein